MRKQKTKEEFLTVAIVKVLIVIFSFLSFIVGIAVVYLDLEPFVHICMKLKQTHPQLYKSVLSFFWGNQYLLYYSLKVCQQLLVLLIVYELFRVGGFFLLIFVTGLRALSQVMAWTEKQCFNFRFFLRESNASLYKQTYLLCYLTFYYAKTFGFCMTSVGVWGSVAFNYFVITYYASIPLVVSLVCMYCSFLFIVDMLGCYYYASLTHETSNRVLNKFRYFAGRVVLASRRKRLISSIVRSLRVYKLGFGLGNCTIFSVHKQSTMMLLSIVMQRTMEVMLLGSLV